MEFAWHMMKSGPSSLSTAVAGLTQQPQPKGRDPYLTDLAWPARRLIFQLVPADGIIFSGPSCEMHHFDLLVLLQACLSKIVRNRARRSR